MGFIRQLDGTYRFQRQRTPVAECDILAAAEDILRLRLERQGAIKTPRDAAEFLRLRIGHLVHEEFHVLWLDTRHRILAVDRLFSGTLDGTAVHPREVVRRALDVNAGAAVLAHNHPSGVCEPSSADLLITEELKNALRLVGVRLLDHLIVGAGATVSLAERGAM
ncbi:DNA repair protein RadC [Tahibacter aquaticus]|uniref:DNA repair protein RadC n=1 Tax=Tahibacter aquaticus TaxID=520092 RepID=A0A4R6YPI7_9GAMM|nr:DNA repair protein RadC [Tahibacter aquaticus]TDR39697.1 DNA repair protein RadC [Tahibacter aquaticus]